MIIFLFIQIIFCQDCPFVFQIANPPSTPIYVTYAPLYNYLITAYTSEIYITEIESGTTIGIIPTPLATTAMYIEYNWVIVGNSQGAVVYDLSQNFIIIGQLDLMLSVSYFQFASGGLIIISAGPKCVVWDLYTMTVKGQVVSNEIQQMQSCMLESHTTFLLLVGLNGNTQYTEIYNMNTLIYQAITTYGTNIIYSGQINANGNVEIKVWYLDNNDVKTVLYLITPKNSVSVTVSTLSLSHTPVNLQVVAQSGVQGIYVFEQDCYYQYTDYSSAFGAAQLYSSSCAESTNLIKGIVALNLQVITWVNMNQAINIYQGSNLIRSLQVINENLTPAAVLTGGYTVQVGQTSNNVYVYNQWFQIQQILSYSSIVVQTTCSVWATLDNGFLLVLNNMQLILFTPSTSSCQFSQFTCFTYTLSASSTVTLTTPLQCSMYQVAFYDDGTIQYQLVGAGTSLYIFGLSSNSLVQESLITTTSQIYQVFSQSATFSIVLSNKYLVYSWGTTTPSSTISIQGTQMAFLTNYQVSTDGTNLYVYDSNFDLATTIEGSYPFIESISSYKGYLVIQETNSYALAFISLANLLNKVTTPTSIIQTQYYIQSFQVNNNNQYIIINYQNIFTLTYPNVVNGAFPLGTCVWTNSYTSTIQYISTDNSMKFVQGILQTYPYLQMINITMNINGNFHWNQLVQNSTINANISLIIQGVSLTSSLIQIQGPVSTFNYLSISKVQMISLNCNFQAYLISQIILNNVQVVNTASTPIQCPFYQIEAVQSASIHTLTLTSTDYTTPIIQLNNVTQLNLISLSFSGCTLTNVVQSSTSLSLSISGSTFTSNTFSATSPIFTYSGLSITNTQFISNTMNQPLFRAQSFNETTQAIITLSQITLTNNIASADFYFIQQYLYQQTCQITINTITLSGNSDYYAILFIGGSSFQMTGASSSSSLIEIVNFKTVTIQSTQFTGLLDIGMLLQECQTISLTTTTITNSILNNLAFIQIENEYTASTISVNTLTFTNTTINSQSLAYQTYGFQITCQTACTSTLTIITASNCTISSQDQSSTALISLSGYQSTVQITASIFTNNYYSLSSVLFILNLNSIILNNIQVYNFTIQGTISVSNLNQNGGIGQIYCESLTVQNSVFQMIDSLNGVIFYLQTFSLQAIESATITLTNVNLTDIYALRSGAFYLDNANSYTSITFTSCTFTDVISQGQGGILFVNGDKLVIDIQNTQQFLTATNASSYQPFTLARTISFISCVFINVYSTSGNLLIGNYFKIILQNSQISTQTLLSSFTQTYPSGSLMNIQFCNVFVTNFIINSIEGQKSTIFQLGASYMIINNLTVTNCINQQVMQLNNSYLNAINLVMTNVQQSPTIIQSINSVILIQNLTSTQNGVDLGCISLYNSNMTITQSQFQSNIGAYGSAIYISSAKKSWLNILQSTLSSNAASGFGTIYANLYNNSQLLIYQCTFYGNLAVQGGALYSTNQGLNSDGSLYDLEQTATYYIINYTNNTFQQNKAQYGGAIKILQFACFQSQNQFINNSASVEGNDVSSYPSQLYLQQPADNVNQIDQYVYNTTLDHVETYRFIGSNGQYYLNNTKSGVLLEQTLSFILHSSSGQQMFIETATMNIHNPSSNYQFTSNQKSTVPYYQGSFNLSVVYIYGVPNTSAVFTFTTNAVKTINASQPYYFTQTSGYTMQVNFRSCLYGETINELQTLTTCDTCSAKFYSLTMPTNDDPGQCSQCPQNANIECIAGALISVDPGYWRESVIDLKVYQCDSYYSSCLGGIKSNTCGIGYVGPLCQVCDYANGYARDTYQQCVSCTDVSWPLGQIIATSVLVSLYSAASIYFVAKDVVLLCILPCLNQLLPINKRINPKHAQKKDLNSLMKIFLAYFQIVTLVRYVTPNIPLWADQVSDPNILSFSLECPLLPFSQKYQIPMVYIMYLITIMVPVLCFIFFVLVWLAMFFKNRTYRKIYNSSTWLVLWLFFLPDFYSKTLKIFNCETIGDYSYVEADMTQICYGTTHFFYIFFIGIPFLSFFVFYMPIMMMYKIKQDLDGKHEKRPMRKYRYYYINGEFKSDFYYWEFFRLAEKLAIQTAVEVFAQNVSYMAEACLVIVMIYGLSSYHNKPYGFNQQNEANIVSSITQFVTIFISLILATIYQANPNPSLALSYFIIALELVMAIINVIFIAWIISKIVVVLLPVIFVNISQIQQKISHMPLLRRYLLTSKLRAQILLQGLVQRVMVIQIIRKKTQRKLIKEKMNRNKSSDVQNIKIQDKLSSRRRAPTFAETIHAYINRIDNVDHPNTDMLFDKDAAVEDHHPELELPEYKRE